MDPPCLQARSCNKKSRTALMDSASLVYLCFHEVLTCKHDLCLVYPSGEVALRHKRWRSS
eukprot:scaffold308590_cov14-Tisochrysis_lutea.AAC.1